MIKISNDWKLLQTPNKLKFDSLKTESSKH